MVKSAIHHIEFRKVIRETWGNKKDAEKYNTKILFTVARSADNESLNRGMMDELERFDDMVVCDFIDSYSAFENFRAAPKFVLFWGFSESFSAKKPKVSKSLVLFGHFENFDFLA